MKNKCLKCGERIPNCKCLNMNIEEAIEILKEIQETNRAWLKETEEEICEKIYLKDIEAIDTVLKELEEQTEANKELNKVLITFKSMINEMADYISNLDIEEDICMKNTTNTELCNEKYTNCKECIKEYFYKKAQK